LLSALIPAASVVVVHAAICASSICAASVFDNWRSWDRFPALLSRVGSDIADFPLPISNFGDQSAIGIWQLKMEFLDD
jgi:hypothetical protein